MNNQQYVDNNTVEKHTKRTEDTWEILNPLILLFHLLLLLYCLIVYLYSRMIETNKSYTRGKNITQT